MINIPRLPENDWDRLVYLNTTGEEISLSSRIPKLTDQELIDLIRSAANM